MDLSSHEKMARFSRQMMLDFLMKNYQKTIACNTDNDVVATAKKRFHSILSHIFEGEYLYFLNPIIGSKDKPDITKMNSVDVEAIIEALEEPRQKLYKALEPFKDRINDPIPGTDNITPVSVYFWLVEHDAWHHGQMEMLVEIIDKGSLQSEIVFEDEQ